MFEAHALASLGPATEHLILIGDHEQLRPKPEEWELQTESGRCARARARAAAGCWSALQHTQALLVLHRNELHFHNTRIAARARQRLRPGRLAVRAPRAPVRLPARDARGAAAHAARDRRVRRVRARGAPPPSACRMRHAACRMPHAASRMLHAACRMPHVLVAACCAHPPPGRSLIRAPIYPALRDHASVGAFPPVRGLLRPLFFLDHAHAEGGAGGESKSKFNDFEVAYAVALAKCAGGARGCAIMLRVRGRGGGGARCREDRSGVRGSPANRPLRRLIAPPPPPRPLRQAPRAPGLHRRGLHRDHHALRRPAAAPAPRARRAEHARRGQRAGRGRARARRAGRRRGGRRRRRRPHGCGLAAGRRRQWRRRRRCGSGDQGGERLHPAGDDRQLSGAAAAGARRCAALPPARPVRARH